MFHIQPITERRYREPGAVVSHIIWHSSLM